MSGPLDELRTSIFNCEEYLFGGEIPCRCLSEVIRTIDAFEQAHPGLVDDTEPCDKCGAPMCWMTGHGCQVTVLEVTESYRGPAIKNLCPKCGPKP
jgi:hypothetical protein